MRKWNVKREENRIVELICFVGGKDTEGRILSRERKEQGEINEEEENYKKGQELLQEKKKVHLDDDDDDDDGDGDDDDDQ